MDSQFTPSSHLPYSLQVEAELQQMEKAEAKEWLEMLGVTDGGLASLIRAT